MKEFKGDYLGFTYNGVHSSELGIVRTSNGSRFDENLLPTMQDKTVQVPGGDGTYYFGSYYTQKQFTIPFAFDSLTELQIQNIKKHFGDRKIHDLIFDETPYKTYGAKVTGTATLKYIPFAEGEDNRLYKGEGSIQFTCYNPFARSSFKTLPKEEDCPNVKEWALASGLKESLAGYDELIGGEIKLYNPGVEPADWILAVSSSVGTCTFILNEEEGFKLEASGASDPVLLISSKTNLIEGARKTTEGFEKTGQLWNELMTAGEFFKIPLDESILSVSGGSSDTVKIFYDYYYF